MKSSSIKYNLWDVIFLFWFLTDALLAHSILGTLGQAVFMLYSISKCIISNKLKNFSVIWIYILFVFIAYLNIYLGNSVSPNESRFLLNVLIRNGVFFYSMCLYVSQQSSVKLSRIFIYACLFSSIGMLLYNHILTGSFVIRDSEDGLNGNMMATLNAMAICCIVALDRWKSAKNISIIILLLMFCVLAGTRKAFIVLGFAMCIYILLSNPHKILSNISKIIILLCIILFFLFEVPFFYEIIGNRFETLFSFVQGGDTDASTDTRNFYIEFGLYYFLKEPWIGHGIHCFKMMPGVSTYSHNNYIELLFSLGIPGVIAFYMIHLYILKVAIKNAFTSRNNSNIIAIALIISILMAEYAMVTYYDRAALFYYAMMLCFAKENVNVKSLKYNI